MWSSSGKKVREPGTEPPFLDYYYVSNSNKLEIYPIINRKIVNTTRNM